jgi:hypothetical protein
MLPMTEAITATQNLVQNSLVCLIHGASLTGASGLPRYGHCGRSTSASRPTAPG